MTSTNSTHDHLKIALVCTGLGQVYRGYERFTRELFDLVKHDMDIELFKGGGEAVPGEKIFPHLNHRSTFFRLVKFPGNPLFYQMLSYAAFLIPYLATHQYHVVHYSEPGLGNILYHARKKFRLSFRLLFSNGVGLSPEHCLRANHIHQLTEHHYRSALQAGIPENQLSCIPYGFHAKEFLQQRNKASLREKHKLPLDKTIVLCVSAVNRAHKRIDYLLQEFSRLDHSFFLVVCGQVEDPALPDLADRIIPGRYRFMQVPFNVIPELYHAADLFVHSALEEGFCLAILEAMAAKLPVIAHRSHHFSWLLGFDEWLADLSLSGTLSRKIQDLVPQIASLKPKLQANQERTVERFDWKNLKSRYLTMFRNIMDYASV